MSQVVRKLVYMQRYPPSIGATMQPRAYAQVYTAAALSLIKPESLIPSYSLTPSIISGSRGTNISEHEHPRIASPADERYIVLS